MLIPGTSHGHLPYSKVHQPYKKVFVLRNPAFGYKNTYIGGQTGKPMLMDAVTVDTGDIILYSFRGVGHHSLLHQIKINVFCPVLVLLSDADYVLRL